MALIMKSLNAPKLCKTGLVNSSSFIQFIRQIFQSNATIVLFSKKNYCSVTSNSFNFLVFLQH